MSVIACVFSPIWAKSPILKIFIIDSLRSGIFSMLHQIGNSPLKILETGYCMYRQ